MKVVPSQIRDFIDERFPHVKEMAEGTPHKNVRFDIGYAPAALHLLEMVAALPEPLLVLEGPEAAEFGEALAAIQMSLDRWRSGDREHILRMIPRRGADNPVVMVRRFIARLPDERVKEDLNRLPFVDGEEYALELARDLAAVEGALTNQEWKAATVLGGALVEALLLAALQSSAASQAASTLEGLDQAYIGELTDKAENAGLIRDTTAVQCRIAKDFRNLIHPGRAQRLAQKCSRATAHSVWAAVNHVLDDLQRRPDAPPN